MTNETIPGLPLAGLKTPTGEITTGDRPSRTLRQRNARIARAFDLSGKRVLDLGCAEGLHSLYMAESADEVVGIDHRASVIARAEANKRLLGISNVTFKCGDVRDREIFSSNEKFDLVVAWGFLQRITDVFSFFEKVAPITEALSLEWRTPVIPFMSRLSMAYHSPVGDVLDTMNLREENDCEQTEGEQRSDADKIEGQTGFWEPTPGAVRVIGKRLGFNHSRRLGYGERLKAEYVTVLRCWSGQIIRAVTGRMIQQVPLSRVHMIFEKRKHSIRVREPFGAEVDIPEWDQALRSHIK